MPKIWKLKSEIPQELSPKLSEYPKLLAQLLYNRGLIEKDKIGEFLEPKYENLHSPFLFADIQKAVDRIWEAVEQKQKITIYGDYDADAVTANAVLQQTFRYLGVEVESYIPDRFTEGYGINIDALQKIAEGKSKLIITVDCGTNSIDAAEFCAKNQIDLIITDHHEVIGDLPKAYAVINPKNRKDNYPFEDITGVGVAFKLATALLKDPRVKTKVPKHIDGYEKWLLDLVAIGTVADCHSLSGENRILVKFGLRVLPKTKWPGLKALMAGARVDLAKPLDAYTLGFIIAPRLNAAGRLEHASVALNLLLENNPVLAQERALALDQINQRRQKLTESVLSEAKEKSIVLQERKVLVLVGEGWPKGVVGLVAGKLAEEFSKPTIVLERTEDLCTGSARTSGGFDILEALKHASEYLVKFGGHKQAAGMTMEFKNFELFYQKVLDYADSNMVQENQQKVLEMEAELKAEDLSLATCAMLQKFEPFGVDNPKPKFLISDLKILSMRAVGGAKQHMQLSLQKGAVSVAAIAFNSSLLEKNFKAGDTVDAAAELIEDGWNGRKELKLRVVELRNHG